MKCSSPKVFLKGYSKRNAQKQFLTTNFTGLLHYQPEIPTFFPNQPGYQSVEPTEDDFKDKNPLIRDLLQSATKAARSANKSYNQVI